MIRRLIEWCVPSEVLELGGIHCNGFECAAKGTTWTLS